jgi:hypothetical protein
MAAQQVNVLAVSSKREIPSLDRLPWYQNKRLIYVKYQLNLEPSAGPRG